MPFLGSLGNPFYLVLFLGHLSALQVPVWLADTHLEVEPGRRARCSFHQHTIFFPGPEHEPQVPRHRDGDVEVTPRHDALTSEALRVWHSCRYTPGPQAPPEIRQRASPQLPARWGVCVCLSL